MDINMSPNSELHQSIVNVPDIVPAGVLPAVPCCIQDCSRHSI